MTKLSKAHIKQRDELASVLQDAKVTLEQAVELYNAALAEAWEAVAAAREVYNNNVRFANECRDSIATEIRDYIANKSEAWQEGDKGSAYEAWADEWGGEYDEVLLEKPYDLELMLDDVAEELQALPEEPE